MPPTSKLHGLSYEKFSDLFALVIFVVGAYVLIKYEVILAGVSLLAVAALTSHSVYTFILKDMNIKALRLHGGTSGRTRREIEFFRYFLTIVFLFIAVMSFNAITLPTLPQ